MTPVCKYCQHKGISTLKMIVGEAHTEARELQDVMRALLRNFALTPECDDPQILLGHSMRAQRGSARDDKEEDNEEKHNDNEDQG
ncbi:uncharacterized protein G2W53_039556 [Senna tora]|uniref:Uncharacterized protein n=1 Tax=Senna tora TaxID=362788 RepID=A0A834W2Y4_9FABA|nr:uncharacterized protein G2W53_039556 [Senna tora]